MVAKVSVMLATAAALQVQHQTEQAATLVEKINEVVQEYTPEIKEKVHDVEDVVAKVQAVAQDKIKEVQENVPALEKKALDVVAGVVADVQKKAQEKSEEVTKVMDKVQEVGLELKEKLEDFVDQRKQQGEEVLNKVSNELNDVAPKVQHEAEKKVEEITGLAKSLVGEIQEDGMNFLDEHKEDLEKAFQNFFNQLKDGEFDETVFESVIEDAGEHLTDITSKVQNGVEKQAEDLKSDVEDWEAAFLEKLPVDWQNYFSAEDLLGLMDSEELSELHSFESDLESIKSDVEEVVSDVQEDVEDVVSEVEMEVVKAQEGLEKFVEEKTPELKEAAAAVIA